jgi:hypothetical protein
VSGFPAGVEAHRGLLARARRRPPFASFLISRLPGLPAAQQCGQKRGGRIPNETFLGTTGLLLGSAGQTNKTSAASIVIFGKDGKMIWQAPEAQ